MACSAGPRLVLLWLAFACQLNTLDAQDGGQQCSGVCSNGLPVGSPDRPIELPDQFSFISTCGALDAVLPAVLKASDEECKLIQSVGTYCGCEIPEEACQLCEEGTQLTNGGDVVDFEPIQTDLIATTCEFAEAYVHSVDSANGTCADLKDSLVSSCFCTATNSPGGGTDGTGGENVGPETGKCSLCELGADISLPDKDISYIIRDLVPDEYVGLLDQAVANNQTITCSLVDSLTRELSDTDDTCNGVREFIGPMCGCPSREDRPCGFCGETASEQLPVPDPDHLVLTFQRYGFPPVKCEDVRLYLTHQENGSRICIDARSFQHLCDCNGGTRFYLGSTTNKQRMWLAWVPRISSMFSIFGSLYILVDVIKHFRKGNMVMFHQLIGAIGFCDLFSSSAWVLSTLAIPKTNEFGEPDGIYGAEGNEATCKLQGFLIQFGFAAVLYHISLSSYYLLVVRQGWPEHRIKKFVLLLHLPMLVGLGLALGGIPLYETTVIGCYILAPPQADDYLHIALFALVPFSISACISSINMILVYCHVRKQAIAGNRWRFGTQVGRRLRGKKSPIDEENGKQAQRVTAISTTPPRNAGPSLEKRVFWQNVFYLGSFYISWTFLSSSQLVNGDGGYWYWICVVALAPLQGFTNFVIYIRPRFTTYIRERRRAKLAQARRKRELTGEDRPSSSILTRMIKHVGSIMIWRQVARPSNNDMPNDSSNTQGATSATTSADIVPVHLLAPSSRGPNMGRHITHHQEYEHKNVIDRNDGDQEESAHNSEPQLFGNVSKDMEYEFAAW